MATIKFSIEGESINATKLEVQARQFSFIVDEPPALGGNDDGANPVEYLLGSYAGCLNVVFHLVAKEEGININSLGIKASGDIDPARLFGSSRFNRAGFQSINVDFTIDSDANESVINELISKVKSRCPVNDNLSNVTQLNYSVVHSAVTA
jgi:uncharacterized OsmC-like protein